MTVLAGGLETTDYGQQGWNAVHTANMEKLDEKLLGCLLADKDLGEDAVVDPAAITMEIITDSSTGTPTNTIKAISGSGADTDINDNFASVADELAKAKADITDLRTQVVALLGVIRKTGGCGILSD